MSRDRLMLAGTWLLLGLVMMGLALSHPTHATSPDSGYYLRMATDWHTYDGTFPPGYSLLTWLVSSATTLHVLWASKVVNWLAIGFFGWVWAGRVGEKRSFWLIALWFLPGNLRIATYTWSETVFAVLLLEAVWHLYRFSITETRMNALRIASFLIALVWVRYVGLFMLYNLLRSPVRRTFTLYIFGITLLLGINFYFTGYLFGGQRLMPTEPWPELFRIMAMAILNEALLYNYRTGMNSGLFFSAAIGQLSVMALLVWWLRVKGLFQVEMIRTNSLMRWLFSVGLAYFLTLFLLRTISPFDPPNERLMSPGSICWLMALVLSFQSQHSIISRSPDFAETLTNPS